MNKNTSYNQKINNENIHNQTGMHGMTYEENNPLKQMMPNFQLINKRIDTDKLNRTNYNRIRREIKKKINNDADVLLINFIPKEPIKEKYKVETLLHLQREFTDIVIKPESHIETEELSDWIHFFKPKMIMNTIQPAHYLG